MQATLASMPKIPKVDLSTTGFSFEMLILYLLFIIYVLHFYFLEKKKNVLQNTDVVHKLTSAVSSVSSNDIVVPFTKLETNLVKRPNTDDEKTSDDGVTQETKKPKIVLQSMQKIQNVNLDDWVSI